MRKEKQTTKASSIKECVLKNVKKSDIFKIEAIITEIMENAGLEISNNVELVKGQLPDYAAMAFAVNRTSLSSLNGIQKSLGNDFSIHITSRKGKLIINVEAIEETFIEMLEKQ